MTGPEHYREAERLLRAAEHDVAVGGTAGNHVEHDEQVARAQVHATLALTAATMDVAGATSNGVVTVGWSEAIV